MKRFSLILAVAVIAEWVCAADAPQVGKEIMPPGAKGGPMLMVPAGEFMMGCNPASDRKKCADDVSLQATPYHKVFLDAYYIDKYEVTLDQYSECVRAGACGEPAGYAENSQDQWRRYCNWGASGRGNHPINCVCWQYADAYCKWAGKRLPTEAEWEKAARGTDSRKYPWGNAPDQTCAVTVVRDKGGYGCGKLSTFPVGSMPKDKSPYGAMDMQGNVSEWVSDLYGEHYYPFSPARNPTGVLLSKKHTLRGSNLFNPPGPNTFVFTRVGFESSPNDWRMYEGFRCAKTP